MYSFTCIIIYIYMYNKDVAPQAVWSTAGQKITFHARKDEKGVACKSLGLSIYIDYICKYI